MGIEMQDLLRLRSLHRILSIDLMLDLPAFPDLSLDQFRNIERQGKPVVKMRVFLGQEERLTRLSGLGIERSEERSCPQPIQAFAAKHEPTPIRRPAMVTVNVLAVHLIEPAHLPRRDIKEIEIALCMPDGEITIIRLREQEILPVG